MTLSDLINDALSRLNEAANSTAGDLGSGTGAASVLTTAQTITAYLNDAQDDLARTAAPRPGYASYASLPAGTQAVTLSLLSGVTWGRLLWRARSVTFAGVPLIASQRSEVELYHQPGCTLPGPNPAGQTAAGFPGDVGTPRYWYEEGDGAIGIYPTPAQAGTLTVYGYALPNLLVNGADAPDWLPADLHKLLVFYACAMLAAKNLEDAPLQAHAPAWLAQYREGKALLAARLGGADPALAASLPAIQQGQ